MTTYLQDDLLLNISRGLVTNTATNTTASILAKFGYNASVGTTEELIWAQSATSLAYQTTASTMTISSSSTSDTAAGTGARTVSIQGLDGDYNVASETLTLLGTSAVTTTKSYLRVNRMIVITAGTGGKNVGTLYVGTGSVTNGVPAVIQSSVIVGYNQTLQAFYTIPANFTGYMSAFRAYTDNVGTQILLYTRPLNQVFQIKRLNIIGIGSNFYESYADYSLSFQQKTDIEVRALVPNGTGQISASFSMVLIPNQ